MKNPLHLSEVIMNKYLVVWKDNYGVIQSEVSTDHPTLLTPEQWVILAAKSEGYSQEDVDTLIEDGYGLFLVCSMPTQFYV
jgi:hypothetical protein